LDLSREEIIEYYYKSYIKVDGLWFVKTEEIDGFDKALKIDRCVWKILPKIQARLIKSFLKDQTGFSLIKNALEIKLELDRFTFEIKGEAKDNMIKVLIKNCPWHNIMVKSGRKDRSRIIGKNICMAEYSTFLSEFLNDLEVRMNNGICLGNNSCSIEIDLGYD